MALYSLQYADVLWRNCSHRVMCRAQEAGWDASLSDDVVRECARHGAAVTHIAVDRSSAQGNVYVKCESTTAALAAVNALHGRYFDGRLVTVAYVPSDVYHSLFPGAASQAPAAASTALASATSWQWGAFTDALTPVWIKIMRRAGFTGRSVAYLIYITLNLNWENAEALETLYRHCNNLETG